jgi:hypothetical protein
VLSDLREKHFACSVITAAHLGCTAASAEMADATTTDRFTILL